ncbi:MAG: AbrB/MazE/SpoVT family DNA-binding domain-containing protein [Azoarcus sp.]|jgi:bifunctional DNA-binding transcriptional regulator/antitoxin component of YhaV-PrlF toxin-antitoxin module|nr:AbrB/MazE/SpoVT family DNA-binding domain-containing protein [Azoarcus sp.]
MSTAMTLTAKGQFTFNKSLMEHLGVKPGEKVIIKKQPDGTLKIEAEKKQIDLLSLAGSLKTNVQLSDEALQSAIQQSYVRRGMSGIK